MNAYHIKQWNDLYERADTRKVDFMPWYPKQSKLTGLGIGFTLAQPDNLELLGLWTLIETICCWSKKHHRGWLVRNGRPLSAEMLNALLPTVPPAKFQRALDHFCRPEVDWLEFIEWNPPAELPGLATEPAPTGSALGKVPGAPPVEHPEPAPTGSALGKVPGAPPVEHPEPAPTGSALGKALAEIRRAGKNSATDRQTDSTQTDRQTDKSKKKEGSLRLKEAGPSLAELSASKTQWAALNSLKTRLEAIPRAERTDAQRDELQKTRAAISALEKKQREGVFA